MATAPRPFAFNKKYDERGRKDVPIRPSVRIPSFSLRKRRILLGLLITGLVYVFIKYLPTDVTPVGERIDSRYGRLRPAPPTLPHDPLPAVPSDQQYDGPIRFFNLGRTLREKEAASQDNVLFVFSSPQSASFAVTAACAMSNHNRTRVHLANVGRREIALADILALNGISEAECPINFHDAQPDFPIQSTQRRMRISCEAAIGHLHRAQPLRAIFADQPPREDMFVRDAIQSRSRALSVPLLQIPTPDSWMLALDTHSLSYWNYVQVEILIQAPKDSSGSLLRLLRTIRDADYRGLQTPYVTLELPAIVDPFLTEFLSRFRWPPGSSAAESRLTVRHRLDTRLLGPAMAASRFIESFYPARPATSHVLVLSPDAELSRNYYQYAMYMLMECKYGLRMNLVSSKVMGISLSGAGAKMKADKSSSPALLWQLPNADATLFFGDQWVELHEFAARRLLVDPQLSRTADAKGVLSTREPVWLRMVAELLQLTGNFVVYPKLKETSSPFVTVHTELHQPSEEYLSRETELDQATEMTVKIGQDGSVMTAENNRAATDWEIPMLSPPPLTEVIGSLYGHSDSSAIDENALATYNIDGEVISWQAVQRASKSYAERFSETVGECSSTNRGAVADGIESFFCE